jgi:hypothetical protein
VVEACDRLSARGKGARDGNIQCQTQTFSDTIGESTLSDILNALELGKKVIIDTSMFTDQVELLVGSIVMHKIFYRYRGFKQEGVLEENFVCFLGGLLCWLWACFG